MLESDFGENSGLRIVAQFPGESLADTLPSPEGLLMMGSDGRLRREKIEFAWADELEVTPLERVVDALATHLEDGLRWIGGAVLLYMGNGAQTQSTVTPRTRTSERNNTPMSSPRKPRNRGGDTPTVECKPHSAPKPREPRRKDTPKRLKPVSQEVGREGEGIANAEARAKAHDVHFPVKLTLAVMWDKRWKNQRALNAARNALKASGSGVKLVSRLVGQRSPAESDRAPLGRLTRELAASVGGVAVRAERRMQSLARRVGPPRSLYDPAIIAYGDNALAHVRQKRAVLGELAIAETDSVRFYTAQLDELRTAFHRELLKCPPRQTQQIVDRYFARHDDLENQLDLAQCRAAMQRGRTELNYSNDRIHEAAAAEYLVVRRAILLRQQFRPKY